MLKFIGTGSAFNVDRGNNSAYIKEDNKLFLIDCGEDVFQKILKFNLLDEIDEVHVAITHLHSDHVGSLSSLILYCFFNKFGMSKKVNVYYPNNSLRNLLSLMGSDEKYYNFYKTRYFEIEEHLTCEFYTTNHVREFNNDQFSLYITDNDIITWFSGDSAEINLPVLRHSDVKYFYQDVNSAKYPNAVHLPLVDLIEQVPENLRHKVHCMHLDEKFDIDLVKMLGFNVVNN